MEMVRKFVLWVKVYEMVKTENSLKTRNFNKLYFTCNYYSNFFFKMELCFKTENFHPRTVLPRSFAPLHVYSATLTLMP